MFSWKCSFSDPFKGSLRKETASEVVLLATWSFCVLETGSCTISCSLTRSRLVFFFPPPSPSFHMLVYVQYIISRFSLCLPVCWNKYNRTPLTRTLVFRIANYPDRLGPSGKFVENSIKLTCLEIALYRIKYSTVLWLLELQIRRGRKV